ncbi:TIR domain-containing protein [Bacteroides ovatus]|uniref:TIR domain-containing protein n=1 Tax=Bacteroides ovatus TaxID=28116 RepID=UPI00202F645F|nr:TIR domain-containing protein [Bacteroides ovatus]MCM1720528.1 TIR domain-containing protein [Bacteroides ovatus]MCM1866112.1 TIR domain-containing protein [Bacteroides ovatus]MCM1909170.1 TIR domain-containing protein [Bacteroides ovatus]
MKYKYDVFISYSRRDYVDESYNVIPGNAIAEIQNVFDENGITYWFDKDGIYSGQEFIEIITGAIAESKMLIFISSKHSNESMWTAGEIFEALDGEKAIIPVKIDNSQYNKKFKLLIRPLDYIDYQENPQNALKDLLRAINKVKEDIAQKQREEEKLRQEKEAEAKKEKIKEEISILAKDCQRLTLQQIDVVNQIFEKQTYIGNTTKICPICDKEVSISSNFCSRCGWTFPILYYIDGNDTYQLDEKQLSVARTNWRSINMVSELQTIKSNLEIENQRLQRSLLQATEDCKSMTENLKKNESAIQKAKIEIKQMQILNKESDSRIKELEFSIIESKKENEKIKNDLLDKEKRLLYSIEENKQLQKRLSDEQTKARKVQKEYENLLAEQKVKTQSQSKPIVPKQEVSYVNRSTNMASGNSSVVNSNKNKTFKNKNDVFGLVRSLCTGSLITLDTNIITAGLRIYPLIQILAKDYELTYSEKAISNLFTIGNLVNAIWERKTSTIPNTLPPAQKKRKFSSKNDVFNFVRPFCKGKLITLNTGFYVAEIQYADLRKALLEKYNINISEYSLRCHATVGKLIDSIWSEHIKYAL